MCKLDVPRLPSETRKGHIVPGLAHTLLVLIKILCNAGYNVVYYKEEYIIYFNGQVVWTGHCKPTTWLWVLKLKPMQMTTTDKPYI